MSCREHYDAPGAGYCMRLPVVMRGAQTLRPYLATVAAALATVADWLQPIDHTTWANHCTTDKSRDLRVNN